MPDTKVARELGGHRHAPDASVIADADGFWQARPILTHIRDYARARRASPWATLGAVLARVVTATTPGVRLPPLGKPRAGGGEMSLNTFVALVGESGAGKDVAIETAAAAVDVGQVNVHGPGSGEGLSHLYVHRVKDEIVQHTVSVLLVAREVATLTALLGRQSSTLGGALRSAYTGAELGFSYADKDKRLPVPQHAYRLGLIVGVQPAMAGPLLDEAVSGTPQRFIWLPAGTTRRRRTCAPTNRRQSPGSDPRQRHGRRSSRCAP